ncbi:GcrA family cell cycle regulator, partial [Pseudomonas fluorescens]|nr:GcrA family cell cycle regulator [Pseudomonas fluorescens]
MPVLSPTWTNERIELLKQHFEAGLSCREIAADIGVSRNAVIGKLSRLNLTRGRTVDDRKIQDRSAASGRAMRAVPRLQYQMLATIYG